MEMKETYIAPEVELLCFEPVENIASSSWGTWGFSSGNGVTPESTPSIDGTESTDDPEDGDGFGF